jgi:enoyl-CoA hydratase
MHGCMVQRDQRACGTDLRIASEVVKAPDRSISSRVTTRPGLSLHSPGGGLIREPVSRRQLTRSSTAASCGFGGLCEHALNKTVIAKIARLRMTHLSLLSYGRSHADDPAPTPETALAMNSSAPEPVAALAEPPILWVRIQRPEVRNAVDGPTALALARAFEDFDRDPALRVAILTGSGGHFCAGADLGAVASGDARRANRLDPQGDGPMGPTRMQLSKPVIAGVEGYCVAGGLELALWCDLRIADETAIFGVFCRRFGVPLIDGGTIRLPRAIGMSRALDMILTGRPVVAEEALAFGLANRVVKRGALESATRELALQLAAFPQACMRNDRRGAYEQWSLAESAALRREFELGMQTLGSGETAAGATRFTEGVGRHGKFDR